ncbi:YrhC family protein [Pallidibacillus pasinlerensis]|uniref:YrhC-like protein n=1 Tax=Pallidibacillus pasinlerensis TaxID=2703818 RepID=A0ABX0A231_9BACI|nr:YrhC family protein [Pallidibacillus pasinlerensis]NCU17488.1 hypothetical protein [Pallidibacillus pasinlerensis]
MRKERKLKELVEDFRRFSTVLIALCVFIYIGIIIKGFSSITEHIWYLIAIIVVLITLAFMFLHRANKYQKKLMEMDEDR